VRGRRLVAIATAILATLELWGCAAQLARPNPAPSRRAELGRIVHVADGDTVTVRLKGRATPTVRLLAMDSPERYATRYGSPDECGSLAASAFMDHYRGARVELLDDPSQDDRDRYGRLLRYVVLRSGVDLGALEVSRGLAMPYLYRPPARRYRHYRALALTARRQRRGSWGPPCEGDFHSSVPGVQSGL
jgi:micrococcal nuclease